MRQCRQLDGIDPRYDPTVIPLPDSGDEASASYTEKANLHAPPKENAGGRFYTIEDFHGAYKNGVLTPTDVVEALLPLIRRDISERSPLSTAFMESRVDEIRKAAAESTQRWKTMQTLGILDGVPFAVKDDLEVKGYKRYIGTSHDYTEGGAKESSWCVKKLEEEGAILVGKLNMHELGMGE